MPPLSVPVPSVAVPSRKVTVPVGVPAPGAFALTVAVKVTLWPNTEGLVAEVTARGGVVLVDGLGQGAGATAGIIGVAVVAYGDGVAADREVGS